MTELQTPEEILASAKVPKLDIVRKTAEEGKVAVALKKARDHAQDIANSRNKVGALIDEAAKAGDDFVVVRYSDARLHDDKEYRQMLESEGFELESDYFDADKVNYVIKW
ncbi:hypothetical protein [Weissella cibaria]|uniref:hypothetical protein n=1 Tax=Weissella cibaria TaxID=137591 RepID=UPI00106E755D|nr:hypothetical protein [Weissella cibaria]